MWCSSKWPLTFMLFTHIYATPDHQRNQRNQLCPSVHSYRPYSNHLSVLKNTFQRILQKEFNQHEDIHTSVVVIAAHVYFMDLGRTSLRYQCLIWWKLPAMVPTRNKALSISSINYSMKKFIHHYTMANA